LGNKPWAEKALTYGKSRLIGTKKLTQYAKWGREEILERQRHMANLATARWHFQ
jgi:hypothetical protein